MKQINASSGCALTALNSLEVDFMTQTPSQPTPDSSYSINPPSDSLPVDSSHSFTGETLTRFFSPKKDLRTKAKAALASLLIGLVPVALIGTGAYIVGNNLINQQVRNNMETNVIGLAEQLEHFINDRYSDLVGLAQQDIFTNPQIRAFTTTEAKNKALNRYRVIYPAYESLVLLDLQGNPLAQTSGTKLSRQDKEKYFQTVVNTKRFYISEPRINKTAETSSFSIAVPVNDQSTGQMIGVLKGNIPLKNFDQLFSETMEQGMDSYYLINSDSNIAATNHTKELGKTLKEEFPKIDNQLRHPIAPITGTLIESHDRQESLIAYTQPQELQEKYKLNWRVVVTQDKNKAFAAGQWLYLIPLLGILTAAGVAGTAGILAEKATRPIRVLAKAVKKIGQGDLDTQVEVKGEDELAILGNNINAMTFQLKSLVQEQALSVQQANLLTDISSTMLEDSMETEEALTPIFNKALEGLRLQLNSD